MERNPDYYFTYEVKDGQAEILDIKNFNLPYLKIPETINNLPVYKINKTAFNKSFVRNLYQIQLPDTITCLDDNCFNEKLENIYRVAFEGNFIQTINIYPNTKYHKETFSSKRINIIEEER